MMRMRSPFTKWNHMNFLYRVINLSNSPVSEIKPVDGDSNNNLNSEKLSSDSINPKKSGKKKSQLVAQVFANLGTNRNELVTNTDDLNVLEQKIKEAKSVDELLSLSTNTEMSRKLSFQIFSILGDWTTEKKIKLSDFEKDMRFVNMCRVMSSNRSPTGLGDLEVVLGVTGDDEAAKLISNASLSQMVRIMSKLSASKKRSPPILRSLAFNVSKSEESLNIKQCADLLFAMVTLNFHDEVLLVKVCADACATVVDSSKSSVVGSIAKSIGMLRSRDTTLLDRLSEWLMKNLSTSRPQDIVAILMAMALVDFHPTNSENLWKVVMPILRPLDLPNSTLYLDAVWSLLLLDRATYEQIACVLSAPFVEKLQSEDGGSLSVSSSLKLLNIDAAAKTLLKNYKGPMLGGQLTAVPLTRSRDKSTLVNCVMDTLANLLPGETYLQRDVDTKAGFLIDGECVVDQRCTPLPVTMEPGKKGIRIAVIVLGYHDTCVGARFRPNGVNAWAKRLLEARGYRVLQVLHSEFSPASKLVQRVQYLENKLKSLVSS